MSLTALKISHLEQLNNEIFALLSTRFYCLKIDYLIKRIGIKQIATDDELRSLQVELIANPLKGELIKETGGLRKVRMATGHKGKSGSTRVIYFVAHLERIYFVLAYHKATKTTLSKSEKAQLKELVIKLKGE